VKDSRREHKIVIPTNVTFSDLKLARDPVTGGVRFSWEPIERICAASGIDISAFRDSHEDNVAGLITQWYEEHLRRGGARDPVQDDLIAEALAEGDVSYKPGRA
jgi:hypothetical protein